jgi:hypothetical protein
MSDCQQLKVMAAAAVVAAVIVIVSTALWQQLFVTAKFTINVCINLNKLQRTCRC